MVEKACRYAFDLPTPEAKGKQHERPPDWPKHRINEWKLCGNCEKNGMVGDKRNSPDVTKNLQRRCEIVAKATNL